jgi:L-lactate dehydrogenase complex protein LldG
MSSTREVILGRIRSATRDVPSDEPSAHEWATPSPVAATAGLPDLFAERVAEYRATVTRVGESVALADAVAAVLGRHDAHRIAVPADLPPDWRPAHAELAADDPPLANDALGAVDGVLTGCAMAIAETGTIVLDAGRAQGRRALTLLPDLHVCVVRAEQVVAGVPDAVQRLAATTSPVTFVSGPSATSDIELDRVEGVHGPRRLEVLLVG